jgi:hypothetical protein
LFHKHDLQQGFGFSGKPSALFGEWFRIVAGTLRRSTAMIAVAAKRQPL